MGAVGGEGKNLEGVGEVVGEDEGGALEEVLEDGGPADGRGLDEVGVDLVEVEGGFALAEEESAGVVGEVWSLSFWRGRFGGN